MKASTLLSAMKISAAGLSIQRRRLNAISSNIANAETTRTSDGGPYKKQYLSVNATSSGKFDDVLEKTKLNILTTNKEHIIDDPEFFEDSNIKIPEAEVKEDQSEPRLEYDPSHPDADENGYVKKPNINLVTEMTDMISASRSYEANVVAVNAAKGMFKDALEI
jgi:flagellar basal-body rod protein FlgC